MVNNEESQPSFEHQETQPEASSPTQIKGLFDDLNLEESKHDKQEVNSDIGTEQVESRDYEEIKGDNPFLSIVVEAMTPD